ncbi:MAG: MFS transporter [Rhodospirillales bacterium]
MKLFQTFNEEEFSKNWRVIVAGFVMAFFAWGMIFYAHGVFKAVLEAKYGWSAVLMSFAQTWFWFVGAIAAFLAGAVIDRLGPRTVAYYGAAATAFGLVAITFVNDPWQLFLAYAILATAYPPIGNLGISAALAPIFEKHYATALSLALTGASLGGAIVTPLYIFLTSVLGFEMTSWILAAITFISLTAISRWTPTPPLTSKSVPNESGVEAFRSAIKSPIFWVIWLTGLFSFTGQVGFLFQEISIFLPRMGLENAGYAVSLTVIAAAFGRFILGWAATIWRLGVVASGVYAVQAIGLLIALIDEGVVTSFIAAFIIGLAVGPVVMLPAMLIRAAFGPRGFGKIFGLSSVGMFGGMMIGPGITGLISSYIGTQEALSGLVACQLVSAVLIFFWFKSRVD